MQGQPGDAESEDMTLGWVGLQMMLETSEGMQHQQEWQEKATDGGVLSSPGHLGQGGPRSPPRGPSNDTQGEA